MKNWLLALLLIPMFANAELRLEKAALADALDTTILVISGNNPASSDAIVVIRADDSRNPGYADRANIERVIPPGEFHLDVPFASFRTPAGRQLDLSALEQIIVFAGRETEGFVIQDVSVNNPPPLGKGIFAWDLGPVGSAIWPGFNPLTPDSPLLAGHYLQGIDRSARMQAADALTFDGIRGIETMALPLPAGKWNITLWLRDPGEWEYLPHPLEREIRVDGRTVFQQRRNPQAWIDEVYLGRQNEKVSPRSSSWDHFGERKSDRVTFNVSSSGKPVLLSLLGDTSDAQFVSAILAAPAYNPQVLEMLTRQRKLWWDRNWPVADWTKWPTGQPRLSARQSSLVAAPDTSVLVTFDFEQGNLPGAPLVVVNQPQHLGKRLHTDWHWSQWQLTRTHLSSTLLAPNDDYFRHGMMPENDGVALPRRLVVRVGIPANAQPGDYEGQLQVKMQGTTLSAPFSVSVVNTTIPALNKPVGIYLEKPVHFGWFPETNNLGIDAMQCDLRYLHKLGLTGISPPYSTPSDEKSRVEFNRLSDALATRGFFSPLAYAPAKRLTQALGVGNAAMAVQEIETEYKKRLQPTPYWSIADEPSNPGNKDLFLDMHKSFSMLAPEAKLAGHLNSREDRAYLSMFDLVLINDGFGIDVDDVQETQKDEREVWLYNLPHPRAAAGFYLWRSGADGFLKWHGRMPTADPFDPTDGREFDVQLLYPSAQPCPDAPDIHADLYEIAQGIVDHRWLQWLEEAAETNPNAKSLLLQMTKQVPDTWEGMLEIDTAMLETWRAQIIDLAR